MDQATLDQIEAVRTSRPELEVIVQEHHDLDDRVAHLSQSAHLTADEQLELARLKKKKLMLRDQIEDLIHDRKLA